MDTNVLHRSDSQEVQSEVSVCTTTYVDRVLGDLQLTSLFISKEVDEYASRN